MGQLQPFSLRCHAREAERINELLSTDEAALIRGGYWDMTPGACRSTNCGSVNVICSRSTGRCRTERDTACDD